MRAVWLLAGIAAAAFAGWVVVPDIWWLTIALLSGGGAAYRAVAISSLEAWWRYVVGLSPAMAIIMLWWVDGPLLALMLWAVALLMLRLVLRGLLTERRTDGPWTHPH